MTPAQREQVVELLRCAADLGLRGESCPLTVASIYLESTPEVLADADRAVVDVPETPFLGEEDVWPAYGVDLLEAARRVEEGWSP